MTTEREDELDDDDEDDFDDFEDDELEDPDRDLDLDDEAFERARIARYWPPRPWRAPASEIFVAIFDAAEAPQYSPLGMPLSRLLAHTAVAAARSEAEWLEAMDKLFIELDAEGNGGNWGRAATEPIHLEPLTDEGLAEFMRVRERELAARAIARAVVAKVKVRKAAR